MADGQQPAAASVEDDRTRPQDAGMRSQAERLDRYVDKTGNKPAFVVNNKAAGPGSAWPSRLTSTDSRDDKYGLRAKLVTSPTGIVPGVGLATVGDEYFEYADSKRKELQLADFRGWLMSNMSLNTPESQAYWRSKFPEIFQDKLELAKNQLEKAAQMQRIAILGPESMEDWFLIYALQKGLTDMPDVAPWQPGFVPTEKNLKRALFNPKRFFPSLTQSGVAAPAKAVDWSNPFNRTGAQINYGAVTTGFTAGNNAANVQGFMGGITG